MCGWEGSQGELMTALDLTSLDFAKHELKHRKDLSLHHYTTQTAQATALNAMMLPQRSRGEEVGNTFEVNLS